MIDFLLSTGIRVGELVRLNIDDIDFSERECVVYGKGDKERKTYFDAKAKIHLINYIESRMDDNSALFVSLNKPHSTVIVLNVMLTLWSVKNIYVVIINRPNRTLKTFSLTEWQIPICLTVSM
jgi:site-specific recombinase XerD